MHSNWLLLSLLHAMAVAGGPTCRTGHWPLLKRSCEVAATDEGGIRLAREQHIFADQSLLEHLPSETVRIWNLSSLVNRKERPCRHQPGCIAFALFPHDPSVYGIDGSNYYVFHVDILLPVWNYLNYKLNCEHGAIGNKAVYLFHFLDGKIKIDTDIFLSNTTFWSQSFQMAFGDRYFPVNAGTYGSLVPPTIPEGSPPDDGCSDVCFHQVSFGVSEYSFPSKRAVTSLSQQIRQRIFDECIGIGCMNSVHTMLWGPIKNQLVEETKSAQHVLNVIEKTLCVNSIKHVGLVTRRGRRRIVNEMELLAAARNMFPEIEIRLIDFGSNSLPNFESLPGDVMNDEVRLESKFTMRDDLLGIQDLAVLIGIQGSGMINGLYTSKVTAVSTMYSSTSWPLSSGDPLELLSLRGPYDRHVCEPGMCPMTCDGGSADKYCDSGDVTISPVEFLKALENAVDLHIGACEKIV